ncbi:hypothetical protein ACFVYT_28200 [Streptomyces sp. NPDC058290]|uniref:hypothetical protein n=1 Tax=Streptomyces sp. NPDC058290 TaxID=3346426 RepID=UPI0036EB9DF9
MAAADDTSEPGGPVRSAYPSLVEAAWLYQADQVCPEDLPMTAAQALAMGTDTPTLCELAGLPRHADPRDIRDTFEQALEALGIALPDHHLARRYALRRLASRITAGEVDLAELASDEWSEGRSRPLRSKHSWRYSRHARAAWSTRWDSTRRLGKRNCGLRPAPWTRIPLSDRASDEWGQKAFWRNI